MREQTNQQVQIRKVTDHNSEETRDFLAVEEPLEIRLQTGTTLPKGISITMRTPGADIALATGFLYTEGILPSPTELKRVIQLDENIILVSLTENADIDLSKLERNFYTTSSCGVCGKTSIEAIKTISNYNNIEDNICVPVARLLQLEKKLKQQQAVFETTGGLHASALFDLQGKFIMLREDVGRHNALDKLIGASFLKDELPLTNNILLLSGRASFELVQKATMAGVKIIAAVGAPSSLAVQLAEEAGITLIGFLRNEGFNIYTGEERVILNDEL